METLLVERKDGVATVTMNRPERKNAANGRMLLELREIFVEIEAFLVAGRDGELMRFTAHEAPVALTSPPAPAPAGLELDA